MKRIKFYIGIICLMFIMGVVLASAEPNKVDSIDGYGIMYVNGTEAEGNDPVVISDNAILVPLRRTLEALGSEVRWEESTGNVYFDYANVSYRCVLRAPNSYFPDDKNIYVSMAEKVDSRYDKDHIKLSPWGGTGWFYMINDRIYLYQTTAEYLLKALGCQVNIDLENKTLNITNQ